MHSNHFQVLYLCWQFGKDRSYCYSTLLQKQTWASNREERRGSFLLCSRGGAASTKPQGCFGIATEKEENTPNNAKDKIVMKLTMSIQTLKLVLQTFLGCPSPTLYKQNTKVSHKQLHQDASDSATIWATLVRHPYLIYQLGKEAMPPLPVCVHTYRHIMDAINKDYSIERRY